MKPYLLVIFLLMPLTCQAIAAVTESPATDIREVFLTVYNNGEAFMSERRTVGLTQGENEIVFSGLSKGMLQDSVHVRILSPAASVTEQGVSGANMTRREIARRFVNRAVRAVSRNASSGEDKVEEAILLAIDEGYLLKIGDRIETDFPGRLVFPYLPEDLQDEAKVHVKVDSKVTASGESMLSYMIQGINWQAEYNGMLAEDENKLLLGSWARIDNATEDVIKGADTYLVAGTLHRSRASVQPKMVRMAADMAAEAVAPAMEAEPFSEYYRFKLKVPLSMDGRSVKRFALFPAREVPCKKVFSISGDSYIYRAHGSEKPLKQKARVALLLRNSAADHLGMPLPSGRLRIYQQEASGHVLFAGEDTISHVPVGEEVEVTLGESFDVRAEKRQLAFTLLPSENRNGYAYESTRSIKLINSSMKKRTVKIVENLPGDWTLLKNNFEPRQTSAHSAIWFLDVTGGDEETLLYTVRVKER